MIITTKSQIKTKPRLENLDLDQKTDLINSKPSCIEVMMVFLTRKKGDKMIYNFFFNTNEIFLFL